MCVGVNLVIQLTSRFRQYIQINQVSNLPSNSWQAHIFDIFVAVAAEICLLLLEAFSAPNIAR